MLKPRVSSFMYALEARQTNNEMIIRNPLNFIALPFIPSTFTFAIIFGLVGFSSDRAYELRVVFKSPNKKILQSWGPVNVKVDNVPDDVPVESVGFVSHFQLQNTPLENTGRYTTEIYVNSEKLNDFPIWVYHRKKQSAQKPQGD